MSNEGSAPMWGRRRFIKRLGQTLALTALPLGLLEACGDSTATPAASNTGASPAATSGTASGTTSSGTTTGATSGAPVKVGVLMTFTGPFTQLGNDLWDGINLYFGGSGNTINGRPIQLIKEDEGSTPDNALQRAKKLVEQDKVDFIIGIAVTNDYLALRDYITNSKTTMIVANAGANALVQDKFSKYIFRASFGNGQYVYPTGDYAYKNLGKTCFMIAPDYAAGHEILDAFKASYTKAGGTIVGQTFTVLGQTTDYAPFFTQIQDAKPQITFAFNSGAESINFIKQYDQFGLKKTIPLCGSFGIDTNALAQMGDAALDSIHALVWGLDLDYPANKKFIADYQAKFNKVPGYTVVFGYDAAAMVAETIKALNGDTGDKDKVASAMASVKIDSPRGPISINPNNHGLVQNVYIYNVVKDANGKPSEKLIKTYPNVPEIGDLLANGLPTS